MFNFIFFVYFLPSFKNIYDVSKPESHKEIVNKEIWRLLMIFSERPDNWETQF